MFCHGCLYPFCSTPWIAYLPLINFARFANQASPALLTLLWKPKKLPKKDFKSYTWKYFVFPKWKPKKCVAPRSGNLQWWPA